MQRINCGKTSEYRLPQVIVISQLQEKGFVAGSFGAGDGSRGWARGLAVTPEGEAALAAALDRADSDAVKYQKVIMRAVINAAGVPVPESELPGYNRKTHRLRGRHRKAFDELRGFGSDIDALTIQRDSQGNRHAGPGPDFERIKNKLGL